VSLKDLTKNKHIEAESTLFMKAVFKKQLPKELWIDYTYNKMLFYGAIETKARAEGLTDNLPDIDRAYKLYEDYREMSGGCFAHRFKPSVIAYHRYILDLEPGKVLAHLYTWHMGDLHGGQIIKKLVDVPHRNLDFKDPDALKTAIRAKLDDSLGDEANIAFDWAIRILNEYANDLDL